MTNQPDELQFGRFANEASAALLECGEEPETSVAAWQAIDDGEFKVTIDGVVKTYTGIDFSAVTSLVDVATVIDTEITADADCYYLINRFNFKSKTTGVSSTITALSTVAAPAGTDISGMLDGLITDGIVLSQGSEIETFETAIEEIETVNNNWYAMSALKNFRDENVLENMADEIEQRRKMFLIVSNDTNTKVLGNTTTFAYYLKNNNYKRTSVLYHHEADKYPDMAWLGMQLPKPIGQTNWAYKTFAGIAEGAEANISTTTLTEAEKDAIEDVNANFYTELLAAEFTYAGTMGGGKNIDKEGEYIDIIRNLDFMQARTEEGLLSLLLEIEIIPFTDAGIAIVDNRLKSLLKTYGVDQKILIEGTVTTSFPKRSEVAQADRDDRKLPGGTFTAELQGAIDSVVVRGTVFI